ncbi:MAG: YfiR family protein [Usitatibacteraceae bacterium]
MKMSLATKTAQSALFARAIACTAFVAMHAHAFAQVNEYEVKAAFLFNFALFTQPLAAPPATPVDPVAPYRMCILGKDPFGSAAKSLSTRKIVGRPIVVKPVGANDDLKQCQLIFMPEAERDSARRTAAAVNGLPIITVGEFRDFPAGGTVFNLMVIDDKVAFQVNTQAARTQQLEVSAKLTRLATSVR